MPVLREGIGKNIPLEDIVPGDVVTVSGGEVIPGDCLVPEFNTLYVDEATLTGETYPVQSVRADDADTPLSRRKGVLWMGTHVVIGSG